MFVKVSSFFFFNFDEVVSILKLFTCLDRVLKEVQGVIRTGIEREYNSSRGIAIILHYYLKDRLKTLTCV